jgi:hypothetical protein
MTDDFQAFEIRFLENLQIELENYKRELNIGIDE